MDGCILQTESRHAGACVCVSGAVSLFGYSHHGVRPRFDCWPFVCDCPGHPVQHFGISYDSLAPPAHVSLSRVTPTSQACTVKTDDEIGANWYPLVIVFSYAMAPVPVVLLSKAGTPPMWQHWAWFTTGWIAVSSFGIAVVYRVAGTIASGACVARVPPLMGGRPSTLVCPAARDERSTSQGCVVGNMGLSIAGSFVCYGALCASLALECL